MFRLVTASRTIRSVVPDELVPVFLAVTLLGSAKFLILALSLAYWNLPDRRDEVLALIGVAFVALTATLVLKYGFDLPRPPVDVQRYPTETSDVGFPSGHAIAATVVYGGAVVTLERHREYRAVLGAGALVVAIGLSRVVLGVHYLGDVVAGLGVGLLLLAVTAVALERGAAVFFGVAAALSIPALVVTDANPDAVLALGGSLGGLAGTLTSRRWRSSGSRAERTVLNALGLAAVGALLVAEDAVDGVLPMATTLNFLLAFGIVALPWTVDRLFDGPAEPTPDR